MVPDPNPVFDLNTFLPYRLNRAAEWVSRRFAAEYRLRYGMTRPEWRALAALGSLGRMTATEIGGHSSMHKTKVSRAVRALEMRRCLRRSEDVNDRRTEHLELTPLGQRNYQDLVRAAREFEDRLTRLLGSGRIHQLDFGLAAIEEAMQAGPVEAKQTGTSRRTPRRTPR